MIPMNKKQIICFIIMILILAFVKYPVTFALETSDTLTVDVNISSVGTIVVNPTSVSWIGINPGEDSSSTSITIKNVGSKNVTNVYITSSTITDESTNPLPTGDPTAYSAGGLIFVVNSTLTNAAHIGRLEWNLSEVLADETLDLDSGTTNFSHGWYRNSSGNEYIWKIENGTNGFCNNTGAVFEIQSVPENVTDMSRDLSSGTLSTCNAVTTGTTWGVFTCDDGPLEKYCIAAANTCDKIYIYKNDYSTTFPTCSKREYLTTDQIPPTGERYIDIFASVPYGMPAGDTNSATLTIVANY